MAKLVGQGNNRQILNAKSKSAGKESMRHPINFYGRRLSDLRIPVLLVHGARDPRTEAGELDALKVALHMGADAVRPPTAPQTIPSRMVLLAEGGHSPHSEPATASQVTDAAMAFVDDLRRHESPGIMQVAGPTRGLDDGGGSAQSK